MTASNLDYARQYRACEEEELRRKGDVQYGFEIIATSQDGAISHAALVSPDTAGDIAAELDNPERLERWTETHTLVTTASHGSWLRHMAGETSIYERVVSEPAPQKFDDLDWQALADQSRGNIWKLGFQVCERVRQTLQADRAMLYRFHPDWSGEVIAEDLAEGLEPFLGLRYPPTDIPEQARDLYCETKTRHIFSTIRADRPLKVVKAGAAALDLSQAISRNVSPYHLEYLANMGSRSTAACALVIDGKLWGLLSIHFSRERAPSLAEFKFLQEFYGQFEALTETCLRLTDKDVEHRVERLARAFERHLESESDPFSTLMLSPAAIQKATGGQGSTLLFPDQYCSIGITPDITATQAVCDLVTGALKPMETCYFDQWPPSIASEGRNTIAGISVTKLSDQPAVFLLCFRVELERTVSWGGDPRRQPGTDEGGRVSPRKSFEKWIEVVKGQSAPWTDTQKATLRKCLRRLPAFLEATSSETALILKNGLRQSLGRRSKAREKAYDVIDGIRSAIAIAVEEKGSNDAQILSLNTTASEAFSITPLEATQMPFDTFERITGISFGSVGVQGLSTTIATANTGVRSCEVSINLLFEHQVLGKPDSRFRVRLIEFRDVTEARRIEESLMAARVKAGQRYEASVKSLAKVSHEIKTPLNAIIGMSSILQANLLDKLNEDDTEMLKSIYSAGLHLADVVSRELDANSFEADSTAKPVKISPAALVKEVTDMMAPKLIDRGIELALEITASADIVCDPRGLRQVLINLMSNAVKYNVQNGQISVSAKPLDEDFYQVIIKDSGVGMSEAQLAACTEPFMRFSNEPGSGLGLSITMQMLELMGGGLRLESVLGTGTVATVTLPSAADEAA